MNRGQLIEALEALHADGTEGVAYHQTEKAIETARIALDELIQVERYLQQQQIRARLGFDVTAGLNIALDMLRTAIKDAEEA